MQRRENNVNGRKSGARKQARRVRMRIAQKSVELHCYSLADSNIVAIENGVDKVDCGNDVDAKNAATPGASLPEQVGLDRYAARD
eukprot:5764394-Pleurochrysis_carterae.AAC.1